MICRYKLFVWHCIYIHINLNFITGQSIQLQHTWSCDSIWSSFWLCPLYCCSSHSTLHIDQQWYVGLAYFYVLHVHSSFSPFADDMSIKLWNWEKNWACQQVFEGHTHYVMQIVINPKDNNTFATASLDRTVKVVFFFCTIIGIFPIIYDFFSRFGNWVPIAQILLWKAMRKESTALIITMPEINLIWFRVLMTDLLKFGIIKTRLVYRP